MTGGTESVDIGYLLSKAARQFRLRFAHALADTGITPQQAAVLIALWRSDGGRLTPRAIADSVDTDQATISGVLERLTRDGWLVSAPNPEDGRSRLIGLSERARATLPGVLVAAETVSAEATACLSAGEVRMLRELLETICSDAADLR